MLPPRSPSLPRRALRGFDGHRHQPDRGKVFSALNLSLNGTAVTGDGLAEMAANRPIADIKRLELGQCYLTDTGLAEIAAKFPNLKFLGMHGGGGNDIGTVTDAGLAAIAVGCPNLKRLFARLLPSVTNDGKALFPDGVVDDHADGMLSVYRCLAAGIRQRTTDCERCSELRTRPNHVRHQRRSA